MKTLTPTRLRGNSDVRRPAIAAAARALIAERGFEGLRTRDIAERVGINVATLHYHVPSKEALIGLVAQSMRDDFIAQSKAWRRDGLTPLQRSTYVAWLADGRRYPGTPIGYVFLLPFHKRICSGKRIQANPGIIFRRAFLFGFLCEFTQTFVVKEIPYSMGVPVLLWSGTSVEPGIKRFNAHVKIGMMGRERHGVARVWRE